MGETPGWVNERKKYCECDGARIQLPFVRKIHYDYDGEHLLLLRTDYEIDWTPAFVIEDARRNIVRLSESGELRWIVEPADELIEGEENYGYLKRLGERWLTQADNDRYYELDVETGDIIESWAEDEFVIGDRRHQYRAPVWDFLAYGDGVFIVTNEFLHAYEEDGSPRWRRPVPKAAKIENRDGDLVFGWKYNDRPPVVVQFEVEPATGAFIEWHSENADELEAEFLAAEVNRLESE